MLQSIRDHAQGWIAWVIVGLIILTFALFGIEQYAQGDKNVAVAEVNGEEVGANEFMSLYNRQKLRLQQQFGDMYDSVVKDEQLREQVLDALIESELIRQWSEENKMLISDPQLAASIQSAQIFQKDGKFDEATYNEVLSRNGLNVARFEYEQRQFLIESQFSNLTQASAFTTDWEVEQLAKLQGQERQVNYLRIDQRPFLKTAVVSDDEIKAFYEENSTAYIIPEKVKIDYVELSQAELAKKIAYTDDDLQSFYDKNKGLFSTPEKRQARHILIRVDAAAGETLEQAEKTIKEIQDKLAAGEEFAELAKAYSQDPGSAATGGDLGSFEQGMMVTEFDDAVFSMKEGQTSEPVKTDFGLHLIKLEKIIPLSVKPLAEVKADVITQFQNQEAEKEYFELLEQMNTLVYEQGDSLAPVAEALGLKVSTTEFFGREGGLGSSDKVTSNGKVIKAAFSDLVLKDGLNSEAIEMSPKDSVAIRLNEYQPERQQALSEVSEDIKADLTREKAVNEAKALAESILVKLQEGELPESVAQDGIEWHQVGWIDRNSQQLLPQMVQAFFSVKKPVDGQAEWKLFQLSTGDTTLLQVTGVKSNEMAEEAKAPLMEAFNELNANSELNARLQMMKANAEIRKLDNYLTIK